MTTTRATLTVKYPTTADRVPESEDAGVAVQARGARHGVRARRPGGEDCLSKYTGEPGARCNKQTAAIRGPVSQRRERELNADSVLPPFGRFSAVLSGSPHWVDDPRLRFPYPIDATMGQIQWLKNNMVFGHSNVYLQKYLY